MPYICRCVYVPFLTQMIYQCQQILWHHLVYTINYQSLTYVLQLYKSQARMLTACTFQNDWTVGPWVSSMLNCPQKTVNHVSFLPIEAMTMLCTQDICSRPINKNMMARILEAAWQTP